MTTLSITVRGTTYPDIPATDAQLAGLGAARSLEMSSLPPGDEQDSETPISERPGYIADDTAYLQMVVERSGDPDPEACANRCLVNWSGVTPDPVVIEQVPPTPEALQAMYAVEAQKAIDATAVARGYSDGVACASYDGDPYAPWDAEAKAFKAWRSATWMYALSLLAEVKEGQRQPPPMTEFLAGMPTIQWPN